MDFWSEIQKELYPLPLSDTKVCLVQKKNQHTAIGYQETAFLPQHRQYQVTLTRN